MSGAMLKRMMRKLAGGSHRSGSGGGKWELEATVRALAESSTGQRQQIDLLLRKLDVINDRSATLAGRNDIRAIDRRLSQLKESSARQYKMIAQALKQASWLEELRVDERRLRHRLLRMKRSSQPVLVGPWSGEVGFELLYWIPFVTWALERAEVSPERVVIVSRGGPASWYSHIGGRYVDAFSYVTPDEFRSHTEEIKKQRGVRPFDREILRRVVAGAKLARPLLLHPGLMYKLFYPFWKQKTTVRRVEQHTAYQPIVRPQVPELAGRLPADYVAVRFYFSASFPDTPQNRTFVDATLRTLSASSDVVLLNTSFHVDDHRDYVPGRGGRVHTIADVMVPERNLEVQTAVIAGARAFVGTYGGYSYLAPLCGVPSLAFYSVREAFFAHHLELAERVFRGMGTASLVPLDVGDADLVRLALAAPAGAPL